MLFTTLSQKIFAKIARINTVTICNIFVPSYEHKNLMKFYKTSITLL